MSSQPVRRAVLLVVAEFPPLGGGGVIRATKLAKYLPRLGWDMTVLTMDESAPASVDETLARDVPAEVTVLRVRGPLRAVGTAARQTRSMRAGVGGRVRHAIKAFVRDAATPDRWAGWAIAASRAPRKVVGRPDVVISSGPPHSGHVAGLRLSRRFGIPLVLDFRDEWHANPLYRSPFPWRRAADWYLERIAVRHAAAAVFVSEVSRSRYATRYPDRARSFVTIPNGFDPEDFPRLDLPQPRDGVITFVHAGSIHGRRDGRAFFEAFGRYAKAAPTKIHLTLIGTITPDQEALARRAIDPSSLSVQGFVPHAEAIAWMQRADVLVALSNAAEAGPTAQTGKVFEYLVARRPILMLAPPSPARDLVLEAKAGSVADPSDHDEIYRALVEISAVASQGQYRGAPDDFVARFDRSLQAKQWSVLLENVIERHPTGRSRARP